jgi:hypothetical protein
MFRIRFWIRIRIRIQIRIRNVNFGSGSDPDPAKSFGSLRIRFRIRNTALFSCVPTGWKAGMVEFVEDAKTFREIQVSYQMILSLQEIDPGL